VLLSPDTALVRHLDPLPAESRQYLDGIVRHQVERLTPWLPTDVLYGYVVEPVGPHDPRLAVTVAATARSLNAPIIAALRAAGVRDIRLLRVEPDLPKPIPVPVDSDVAEAERRTRRRRIAGAAVGLAALAGGAACVLLALDLDRVETELAGVQEAIEARRGVLLAAARQQSPAEQRDLEAMITKKREAPIAVTALEALSKAMPDDTFVSELRLGEGRVRVVGTSRSVAGLVPLVEATTDFSGAGFFAPTTRLPDGRGDRFHIDARWLPPGGTP
jgi:general secretion pathway protein L